MFQIPQAGFNNLKIECQKIETILKKTQDQFEGRHHSSQNLHTIPLIFIKDIRQCYQITKVCEDELQVHLDLIQLEFLSPIIKLISRFHLIQINYLLRCFVEPTKERSSIEYMPKKLDMKVFDLSDFPKSYKSEPEQLRNQKQMVDQQQQKIDQLQLFNLDVLIKQCLKQRDKIESIGSSGAPEQIFQITKSLQYLKHQIGNDLLNEQEELNESDEIVIIQDFNEQMKSCMKIQKTKTTERLISKVMANYNRKMVGTLDQMGIQKISVEVQTDNGFRDYEATVQKKQDQNTLLNNLRITIVEKDKIIKESETTSLQLKKDLALNKYLFKQYEAELDHKLAIINQLQIQMQSSQTKHFDQQSEINFNDVSQKLIQKIIKTKQFRCHSDHITTKANLRFNSFTRQLNMNEKDYLTSSQPKIMKTGSYILQCKKNQKDFILIQDNPTQLRLDKQAQTEYMEIPDKNNQYMVSPNRKKSTMQDNALSNRIRLDYQAFKMNIILEDQQAIHAQSLTDRLDKFNHKSQK